MFKPRNKQESDFLIDKLQLNRVVEKVFNFTKKKGSEYIPHHEMIKFIEESGFTHYGLRSLYPGGPFEYSVPKGYVLAEMYKFSGGVKICESMLVADTKELLLQGYIYINRQFDVKCEANDEPGKSLRHSMAIPKYKWYFNDAEEKAPRILANTKVLELMVINDLFDVVVEFTYYNIPVGRNKEKLLIWEIRNY